MICYNGTLISCSVGEMHCTSPQQNLSAITEVLIYVRECAAQHAA